MHKSRPYWLVSDRISTCRLAKSKVQHEPQQHKTHNSQHEMLPPYNTPQRFCPLRPWIGQQCHQHMALRLTKYPSKASGAGFALDAVGSPVLGAIQRPLKNQRDGKRGWPYGQNLIKKHNNQPEINDSRRWDVGERARGDWSMWRDILPLFG